MQNLKKKLTCSFKNDMSEEFGEFHPVKESKNFQRSYVCVDTGGAMQSFEKKI